jgi:NADH-quinone oxidoreductase subunit G
MMTCSASTDRGSFSTIACHPQRTLDSNYSLNTVDICQSVR